MTASHAHDFAGQTAHRTAVQTASIAMGVVFLLVGVLGFIPGITTNMGSLGMAGHGSEAMLLGVFQVSVLHNVVHLLFGAAGIAMAGSSRASRNFLIWGGAIYLVLWLYGLIVGEETAANFVPLNMADDWLHFVLGAGMIALGYFLTRTHHEGRTRRR